MPDLTPEDRDRLRELAENATPGPWMFDRDQRDGWMVVFGGNEHPHGYNIIGSNEYLEPADAVFIAAARTAVPALLDMLGQAEAERDRQRAFKNEAHQFADRVIQEVADAAGIRVADDGWALDDITAAIRQARTDHARAQVDRVRSLHREFPIYDHEDTCPDTSDEHRQEHHRQGSAVGEFYCDQRPVGSECAECRDDEGSRIDWPCPTIRALDGDR